MAGDYEIHRAAVAKLLYGDQRYPDLDPIRPEMQRRAQAVQRRAKVLVGKKTGRLASRITLTEKITPPFLWYQIEGNTRYAYLHHQGTKPHVISGSLTFKSGSRVTHARIVHHPGTRPNPFLKNALPAFMALRDAPAFRV